MTTFERPSITPTQPQPAQTAIGLAEPPSHGPQWLAGTANGLVSIRSVGQSDPRVDLEGHTITALAVGPDRLWAIADRTSIWQRDADQRWRRVAAITDVALNCLLPFDDTVLVGNSGARLLRLENGSLEWLNGFESVQGRDEWYTPWGDPPDVRSLALSACGDLYVNVHVGGIVRSSDRGQTWQPTIDVHADVHQVYTLADRPDWVLAATAEGLAISTDRGRSWDFDRDHLHGAYARAIAVCGETILMSASTGPRTSRAALYRRPLYGPGGFEKCDQGLPQWFADNINTGTLATAGRCAAFGTSNGEIFGSQDAGLTWRRLATGLAPVRCLTLNSLSGE
ncbi:hypothetical protein [Leptolyngbya sp. KIOST-1]|uniref:hypothetical protein n=1 Tax=Leptolyngbya sp. KIOST-1 TaxID=1229172 RepID=UPI0006916BB1|nr:hypothetical protein [Leptolyngbya sp. KIOST-1]